MQVKPTRAGSSIGVMVAYGVADSLKKANEIIVEVIILYSTLKLEQRIHQRVLAPKKREKEKDKRKEKERTLAKQEA